MSSMPTSIPDVGPHLVGRIVAFGSSLRKLGLLVGSQQIIDGVSAVELVGLRRKKDVRQALFSTFVCRNEDREAFELAFDVFWCRDGDGTRLPGLPATGMEPPPKQLSRVYEALGRQVRTATAVGRRRIHMDAAMTYSAVEALRMKDFAACTALEIEAAVAMMRQMRWSVEPMPVRRLKVGPAGRRFHLPSTLRASLRHGTELLELSTRGRVTRARPMVVLCDISGSMDRYSRMLLHFMHVVSQGFQRVESFLFGTRLTRVTRYLRQRDVDCALDGAACAVCDWGGGTRIGEAIRDFNFFWLRRVLRSTGVVLIISDGFDRGDPVVLGHEMARLRRSCHRLIWLNPLLGYEAYQPRTRGMCAALPHVSDFLAVHNLESLEQLGWALRRLAQRTG